MSAKRIGIVLMLYSIFTCTIGQFIPLYFTNENVKLDYYLVVSIMLFVTVSFTIFNCIDKYEMNLVVKSLCAVTVGVFALIIFAGNVFFNSLAQWTEASTYYVKKTNPNIRIISRYIDLGALGGGSEPSDYHVVKQQKITPFLKLETNIDTNLLDKSEWIKP